MFRTIETCGFINYKTYYRARFRTGLINLKLFNLKKQLAILHGRPWVCTKRQEPTRWR